jgi:hypothetical protein
MSRDARRFLPGFCRRQREEKCRVPWFAFQARRRFAPLPAKTRPNVPMISAQYFFLKNRRSFVVSANRVKSINNTSTLMFLAMIPV